MPRDYTPKQIEESTLHDVPGLFYTDHHRLKMPTQRGLFAKESYCTLNV